MSHPLPDVRDGLSLVHRRVLLAMRDAGLAPGWSYKRSVTIVRDVFKRFRPRARDSAYDALVSMVQEFTSRYPLIEGNGNFGSIDGDPAASPPYTEVGFSPIAGEMLADIDRGDGSTEPGVLGAAFPNLIVNGSAGCPPSTLTNIPPHNLREVVRAAIFLIDHPDATASDLCSLVTGPDFPTGAVIDGSDGIREYQETGRGRVTVRARVEIEPDEVSHRSRIVVTEIPYGIRVEPIEVGIATLVRGGRIEGITDLHNESTQDEMRIVVTLKRDVLPQPLLQQLYELTPLETTIDVNMTALVPQPETGALIPSVLTMKELLARFIAHRHATIAQRSGPDLPSTEQRIRLIKDDLTRIADAYGDRRRTEIRGER
jgi:DNA gyrase subunit A